MAIRGSLKDASLADVLQLLALGQKTGCLSVTHRDRFGYVYFDRGRICYASIVNRRDRLGDALVNEGVLTRPQLDQALLRQRTTGRPLSEAIAALGVVPRDTLQLYLRRQLEEAVYYLLTWTQGSFNFEVDVRPEEREFLASINPEALLLEGARRIDEWSLIEKKIPTFDLVFDLDRPRIMEHAPSLTAEQITLAGLIDGRRDVAALIEESGLSEFDVGKAVYGLLTAGFLHKVGRSRGAETAPPDTRADEHHNLGAAFYKAGMLEDALREFQRVSDLRADDAPALFWIGLVYLRQRKWQDAAETFRKGTRLPRVPLAVYHNLAFALERLGQYGEARTALEQAARLGGTGDPQVRMSAGVLALRFGDLATADAALTDAGTLWADRQRPAAWYHYAALAAALTGDLDRAVSTLAEGIQAYPHAAVLLNNLAVALERGGKYADALAAAERGALEDPAIPQLHKNLGDYHYRAGRYDDAFDSFQRAVKKDPALGADVFVKLGNLHYRRQDALEASRCWERALELAPTNATARNNLETLGRVR